MGELKRASVSGSVRSQRLEFTVLTGSSLKSSRSRLQHTFEPNLKAMSTAVGLSEGSVFSIARTVARRLRVSLGRSVAHPPIVDVPRVS